MLNIRTLAAFALVVASVSLATIWWLLRDSSEDGWRIDSSGAEDSPSAIVFDVQDRRVFRLRTSSSIRNGAWLGTTEQFVAYDEDARRFRLFSVGGQISGAVGTDGSDPLASRIVPAPDGVSLLTERTDDQYIYSDINGESGGTVIHRAQSLAFSPDGQRVAYVTIGGTDKGGINHDGRSIITADWNGVSGFSGGGLAVWSQREVDAFIYLAVNPWSADSRYLLTLSQGCPPNSKCISPWQHTVYSTELTGDVVWRDNGRYLSVQWAGPGRLYVVKVPDTDQPEFNGAAAAFSDLAHSLSPVPAILDGEYACCVEFSPDGRHAIVRIGSGPASDHRCVLVDVASGDEIASLDGAAGDADRAFCTDITWSADGMRALALQGGH
jgi:hypothetical protein